MTDYDRGAYTPQTDAPLAFDPRRPSERRPMPMALIGSAAVLVILLAGVAMVYRGGVRHAGESPRPVGEPVMAVKTAPTAAQSAPAPAANMDVYPEGQGTAASTSAAASQTAASKTATVTPPAGTAATPAPATLAQAPKFAPPAEQPVSRPAPKASTVAMLARPAAPSHIERPATPDEGSAKSLAAETPASASKSATAKPHASPRAKIDQAELAAAGGTRTADAEASAAPKAKTEAKADDDVVAAPAVHKAKPAETAAAAASLTTGRTAVVQIGAFSSSALADKGYADVSATLAGRMAGKAKHVQPLDKDGTTLYRTWLSGFASRADAQAFCEALKAKGRTCLVKG